MQSAELIKALAELPANLSEREREDKTGELVKQFREFLGDIYASDMRPYTRSLIWYKAIEEGFDKGYDEVEKRFKNYASFVISLPEDR